MNRSWKIGILYDTARSGRGGHGTHLAFRGLPGVETVALVDSNCGGIEKEARRNRCEAPLCGA